MPIDCRTRRHCDRRELSRDEVFDSLLPEALERNAELAARGLLYKHLPSLSLEVDGRTLGLREQRGRLTIQEGVQQDGAIACLDAKAGSLFTHSKLGLRFECLVLYA